MQGANVQEAIRQMGLPEKLKANRRGLQIIEFKDPSERWNVNSKDHAPLASIPLSQPRGWPNAHVLQQRAYLEHILLRVS